MRLLFLYGPPAAGKLTVARIVAERTGFALFHNHLVVDAVGAVFPFGSDDFVRLRERFWLDVIEAAARTGRSLIFTFNPESSVAADFPARVERAVTEAGGALVYVALTVDAAEQERRVADPTRAAFGKLRSLDLLRALRPEMTASEAAMPAPALRLDTGTLAPEAAAGAILKLLGASDGSA